MVDCVLMNVVQLREIGTLVGESGFSKVEPDLAVGLFLQLVNPLGGSGVQNVEHGR